MEGTLADVVQPRERGSRGHTPQGGPPTPPGLPVSPKWPVPAPPPPLHLSYCPPFPAPGTVSGNSKKQVGSQGRQGWGKRSPRASPGERGPALLPPPGAGWLRAGHAHGAAGRRAPGGRGARVQLLAAGSRRGPERAGAEGSRPAGSWSRTREREARPQRRRGRSEVCEDAAAHQRAWSAASGDANGGKPPRYCTPRALAAVTSARRERGGGEFRGILGPGVRGAAARERGAQTGRGGGQ